MKQLLILGAIVLAVTGVMWLAGRLRGRGKKADKVPLGRFDDDADGGDKKEGDIVTTKSGLKYIDTKIGAGRVARPGDSVLVHYTGTFPDGKKFDSSRDRGEPFPFTIGKSSVIKGWHEGVAGMKEGGKRTLIIPPGLGYGPGGSPPVIPPNATLHFDIELLKVN